MLAVDWPIVLPGKYSVVQRGYARVKAEHYSLSVATERHGVAEVIGTDVPVLDVLALCRGCTYSTVRGFGSDVHAAVVAGDAADEDERQGQLPGEEPGENAATVRYTASTSSRLQYTTLHISNMSQSQKPLGCGIDLHLLLIQFISLIRSVADFMISTDMWGSSLTYTAVTGTTGTRGVLL